MKVITPSEFRLPSAKWYDISCLTATDTRVVMEDDGNFVAYRQTFASWVTGSSYHAFWASNTDGNKGAFLVVTDRGQMIIYGPDFINGLLPVLWSVSI
jgi:hypothetical protein